MTVKTIKRIRKYFSPFGNTTRIQPIMKIHEGDGCYEIELIKEGKKLEVKISDSYQQIFYQIDPLTGLQKMGYF